MRRANQRPALEAQQAFKHAFGYAPTFTTTAPAAVELLGNQTEHCEGLVLVAAINRFAQMAASPRNDGRIELVSPQGRDLFWLSNIAPHPQRQWAEPIKTVLRELRRRGVPFNGFTAAIYSDIPAEAGLLEFPAVQAATALMVRKLFPYRLTDTGCLNHPPPRDKYGRIPAPNRAERLTIARMCHRAGLALPENQPGMLHLAGSLCGKSFHALSVDCRFHTVEPLPMIGEVVAVLCPTGIHPHAVAGPELAKRRALCESAARMLRARSLRSVDLPYLSEHRMRLSAPEYACTYHIVGEQQRVVFAERALNEGDFLQFGQYLFQSHESSRDFFQNSCLELDLLVDLAREHAGCIGARLTGTGFGGATINLVTWNHYEDFIKNIARQYEHHTGRRIKPFVCQLVDGAA